jgi:hypothetical protein
MRSNLLICLFALISISLKGQVFNIDTVEYNGNPNNRINLLIMGDGYTPAEMGTFRNDSRTVANYFFSVPPLSLYSDFFNFFGIEVESNESGNDHPETASDCVIGAQPVTSVDNYLETTFDYGGTHRCIYSNQSSLVYSIANTNFPLYHYINVIVNTSYYGGCAGGIAYTSMNSSSPEVFVHEFGHMFGELADEYDYGSSPCSPGTWQDINVTQVSDPANIIWKDWLTTAPMPTPAGTNCGLIGAYEGANYCTSNWYRPKCDCKMRSLNQSFCEVCYEQLIFKINSMVNYIDSHSPSNTVTIQLCKNATLDLSANVLNSADNTVRSQWLVDNVVVVNNSTSFTFDPSSYSTGIHHVKLVTSDTTSAVKKTMNSYQVTWTINVLEAPSVSAGSDDTVFCEGQTLNLTSSGTGTVSWTGPSSFSSNQQNPVRTNLNPAHSGSYTVTSTNSCGSSSSSLNITVHPEVNAAITASGPVTFCSGASVELDAGANAAHTYQWYRNSSPVGGATGHSYTAFQSGNYTVRVSINGTSCSSTSPVQVVTVNPSPNASLSTSDPVSFCEGGSALLEAQTGTGYSYQWFRNNQLIVLASSPQWNAANTGTYKVVVTLGTCRDTSSGIQITVNPNPDNTISFSGDTVFCDGDQVTLSVPFCAGCTYQWQRDNVDIGGAVSRSFIADQTGHYLVSITNTLSSCGSASRDVFVDVHDVPNAQLSAGGPLTFCEGDSVILSAPSGPGYFYLWYRDGVLIPNETLLQYTARQTGSYHVIVSDIVCTSQSAAQVVSVDPLPAVSMNLLPDTLCLFDGPVSLTGTPSGGTFTINGVEDTVFNPQSAGTGLHTITYRFTDSNSCSNSVSATSFVDICLGLKEDLRSEDMIIYPNPASNEILILFTSGKYSDFLLRFTDLQGRIIREIRTEVHAAGENRISVNTADFSTGWYFVTVSSSDIQTTGRLLISR